MKQRSRKSLRESYVCLFVVNGLDICCGMMTRLLGQFFSFSSFSLFFCTASHIHTALICYFAVNKRFSSDVCVVLDLCVSSYTYVAYIVESANFWDNIEQKNDFFSMLLMWWNVRNIYGTFIILDFLCACIQFVSIFSSYLLLFHIPAAFFSFATAETSLSLQVISCILDLGMVVWGLSLRQTHIKGWNASLFLFVCNF